MRRAPACKGKRLDGSPCRAPAVNGTKPLRCWAHAKDPKIAARRAQARSLGGRNRMLVVAREEAPKSESRQPLTLSTVADAVKIAGVVVNAVWQGELDSRAANAIVGALQVVVRPGVAATSSQHSEFLEQFESMEILDTGVDGRGAQIVGVLPGGARVHLAGELAAAAARVLTDGADSYELELDPEEPPPKGDSGGKTLN